MKKRKNESRGLQRKSGGSWVYWGAAIFIILALVAIWHGRRAEVKTQLAPATIRSEVSRAPLWYGDAEHKLSVQYVDLLSSQINPAAAENAYMPLGLKNRINWIIAEKQAGRLNLICAKRMESSHGKLAPASTFMGSKYNDTGNASIAVLGPKLYKAIADNGGRIPEISQEAKNFFAVALAHEVIHLENKPFLLRQYRTDDELTQEELRTWMKTSAEVVRHLREVGQPVGIDLARADDVSRRCNYQLPCPELLAFFRTTQQ